MEDETLKRTLGPTAECLSLEAIGEFADDRLEPRAREAVASHLDACLYCQEELALLRGFAIDKPSVGEIDVVRQGVSRLRQREAEMLRRAPLAPGPTRWIHVFRFRMLVTAASVLLLGAAGAYLIRQRAPALPAAVERDHEPTRSLAIEVHGPLGDQTEVPGRFEWSAVSGAARYRVRLTEVDRTELWSADTRDAGLDIPPAARARIVPRKTLLWQVTAYDASGNQVADSGPRPFRLVR